MKTLFFPIKLQQIEVGCKKRKTAQTGKQVTGSLVGKAS